MPQKITGQFVINNLLGEAVLRGEIESENVNINVSALPRGYILLIR